MKYDRRNRGSVLFYALQCAIRDRRTYAEAHFDEGPNAEDAFDDIRAFRRLSVNLFGTDTDALTSMLLKTPNKTLDEIKAFIDQSEGV